MYIYLNITFLIKIGNTLRNRSQNKLAKDKSTLKTNSERETRKRQRSSVEAQGLPSHSAETEQAVQVRKLTRPRAKPASAREVTVLSADMELRAALVHKSQTGNLLTTGCRTKCTERAFLQQGGLVTPTVSMFHLGLTNRKSKNGKDQNVYNNLTMSQEKGSRPFYMNENIQHPTK